MGIRVTTISFSLISSSPTIMSSAAVIDDNTNNNAPGPAKSWRGFSTTGTNYIKADFPDKITGPSVWDGKELEKQPQKWIYYVTEEDIADIDRALQHFKSLNLELVLSICIFY